MPHRQVGRRARRTAERSGNVGQMVATYQYHEVRRVSRSVTVGARDDDFGVEGLATREGQRRQAATENFRLCVSSHAVRGTIPRHPASTAWRSDIRHAQEATEAVVSTLPMPQPPVAAPGREHDS